MAIGKTCLQSIHHIHCFAKMFHDIICHLDHKVMAFLLLLCTMHDLVRIFLIELNQKADTSDRCIRNQHTDQNTDKPCRPTDSVIHHTGNVNDKTQYICNHNYGIAHDKCLYIQVYNRSKQNRKRIHGIIFCRRYQSEYQIYCQS